MQNSKPEQQYLHQKTSRLLQRLTTRTLKAYRAGDVCLSAWRTHIQRPVPLPHLLGQQSIELMEVPSTPPAAREQAPNHPLYDQAGTSFSQWPPLQSPRLSQSAQIVVAASQ